VTGTVIAVCRSRGHHFSKRRELSVRLVAGQGVDGDAHSGTTVKHRSRVRVDPTQPNLRQVHLIHAELFDQLAEQGFRVGPGDMGENITTHGVDLLALPTDTLLRIGADVVLRLTGLRNPCKQIDDFQKGLMAAVLGKAPDGSLIRKSGVMAVVLQGGEVLPGDAIAVEIPSGEPRALAPV
jgi:MOSC domain-containing protein YiiM